MVRIKHQNILRKRIHASSLIEVMISLVLIGIVFSAAMLIYGNIIASSKTVSGLKYQMKLKEIAEEIITDEVYLSDEFFLDEVKIVTEVNNYNNRVNLIHLSIRAVDANNEVLAQHNQLIYKNVQ